MTEDKLSYYNLGEAEYVVAVYQYMRLLGYPANKISILTPYFGQSQLIQTIIGFRCKKFYFGKKSFFLFVLFILFIHSSFSY